MPTRLQDGLSISLLQWMRTVEEEQTRTVIIRISDTEAVEPIMVNLQNAGLMDMEQISTSTIKGTVTAGVLSRVVRCLGVCSVTSEERD